MKDGKTPLKIDLVGSFSNKYRNEYLHKLTNSYRTDTISDKAWLEKKYIRTIIIKSDTLQNFVTLPKFCHLIPCAI